MTTVKPGPVDENRAKLIGLLNKVLKLEYSFIIHYPRLSNAIKDKKISDKIMYLSTASVAHADTVATAITSLGGEPQWAFEPLPDISLLAIFQRQVGKEKTALQLHQECVQLAPDHILQQHLSKIAKEEEWHIQVATEIADYVAAAGITF
ncbi:hypothetical protein DGWBC_0291 [Dehalogenimonas sp. WBC-2]|nr:hypothetical protein DGWBC_0291 [Dehalogenimonas sp. WBC-2]